MGTAVLDLGTARVTQAPARSLAAARMCIWCALHARSSEKKSTRHVCQFSRAPLLPHIKDKNYGVG